MKLKTNELRVLNILFSDIKINTNYSRGGNIFHVY